MIIENGNNNNKCKFSGLLSYTMYQLNVLIPISLYKILVIYIHSNRCLFSNGSFLGIAEMLNIYSTTCSTQLNIQKVIITGQ